MNKKLLPLFVILFGGFCIITNSSGVYRAYRPQNLPFIYRLHSTTPIEYQPKIEAAAQEWNNVISSYFEFQRGPNTSTGSLGNNGENLVFFDLAGENFEPGTNTIAFSSTWTSRAGGYHAVESDYIYNARDFPPGLNGEPGKQDLYSISVHELGHHTGLDHTGLPSGASSGCGPLVSSAVMWAFSNAGDTSRRHLTIEDIMGISSIYPNWVLDGTIKDASTNFPINDAFVKFDDSYATEIGAVINPIDERTNRVGLITQQISLNDSGQFSTIIIDKEFSFTVKKYGYYPKSNAVLFADPSGFGNTQTLTYNIFLQKAPEVALNISLYDSVNNKPVYASYELFWIEELDSALSSSTTDNSGKIPEVVASNENYRLVLKLGHPYKPQITFDSIFVSESGLNLELNINPVSVLLVKDADAANVQERYSNSMDKTGYEYAVWDNTQTDSVISSTSVSEFNHPLTVVWYTSSDTISGLTANDIDFLKSHLRMGGRLILTGGDIAEKLQGDSLINNYIGVNQIGNQFSFKVTGINGDIIGDGIAITAAGYKDILSISNEAIGNVYRAFYYGTQAADTNKIAAVRFENSFYNYKGFFLGFGLESIGISGVVDPAIEILRRAIEYTLDTTSITTSVMYDSDNMPNNFSLSQNYPNPFNPSTTIEFALPVTSRIKVKVYNLLGQVVKTIYDGVKDAGYHKLNWNSDDVNGNSVSSGIYFYELSASGFDGKEFSQIKKMILIK